jgi:hypothetical protein
MEGRGGIVVEEQEELERRSDKRRKMHQPPMNRALV